jgi:ABC-type multidrug transport system ATPase subunit
VTATNSHYPGFVSDQLYVVTGGREAIFAAALGSLTVGAGQTCEIRIQHPDVFDRHLVLHYEDGCWRVDATGAGAHVFSNGDQVERAEITSLMELRLVDPVSGPVLSVGPARAELHDSTVHSESGTLSEPEARDPDQPVASFPLAREVLRLGRDPDSDILIPDVLVSRHHAEVRRVAGGGFEVIDLHSHNGTFVNGRRVERAVLDELDVVGVGRNSYRFIDGRLDEYVDTGDVGYAAVDLTVRLPDGTTLLDRIGFSLRSRSMLAVIGPSGSGKSTLLRALTGLQMADEGDVHYDERSLYTNYEALRRRIGHVPQDDIVHTELTVGRALEFASHLRFPPDVEASERERRVQEVIDELGLAARVDTQIASLSGGQRKRVSVGLELLTAPSLLFLDEPTSGLDPHSERSLIESFRSLADSGRTVVVATHATDSLRLYDRVLMLSPGGKLAYFGPPQMILAYFDRTDIADVFRDLSDDPDVDWGERFREHPYHRAYVEPASTPTAASEHPQTTERFGVRGRMHQYLTLTRRYAAVLAADRRNSALLLLQAPLLGLLLLVALPSDQLQPTAPSTLRLVSQASLVLLVIVIGVSWLGMSNAVREIAKEGALRQRERAAGVSMLAYVASKATVLGVITVVQAAILVVLATLTQHGPANSVLLGWPLGELIVVGALTGLAAMAVGLLISALASTADQATSALPIVLVFMLVLALGGVFPQIANKPVLKQLAYVAPTNWGFAGMASTSDLNDLQAVTAALEKRSTVDVDKPTAIFGAFNLNSKGDALWRHQASTWLIDVGALLGLSLIALLAAWLALCWDKRG